MSKVQIDYLKSNPGGNCLLVDDALTNLSITKLIKIAHLGCVLCCCCWLSVSLHTVGHLKSVSQCIVCST